MLRKELNSKLSTHSEWNAGIKSGEIKADEQETIIENAYLLARPLLQRYSCGTFKPTPKEKDMVDILVDYAVRELNHFVKKSSAPSQSKI